MQAITSRPNFRARPVDQEHAETVARAIQATGTRVTTTTILRHALAVAAGVALSAPTLDLGAA